MKFLVLILLINLKGHHFVLSQFPLPGFKPPAFQIPTPALTDGLQIPTPSPVEATTVPNEIPRLRTPLSIEVPTFTTPSFLTGVSDQLKNNIQHINPPRSFEQIFNPTSSIFNQIVQELTKFINSSFLQNLISSGSRQLNAEIDYDAVPQLIRQSLENAFAQFDKSVNSSFAKGFMRVQNSFGRFDESANSVLELAENLVTTGLQDINSTITKYNETVQTCVYDKSSHYEAIIPDAGDEAKDCVHQKVSEVKHIIENGQSNIVEALDGAQNLASTIQQCSSEEAQENYHFGAIGCYISALFNVHMETISLPVQMTKRFAEIDTSITSAQDDVITCTSTETETIAEQSLNVTETIADCVIKK